MNRSQLLIWGGTTLSLLLLAGLLQRIDLQSLAAALSKLDKGCLLLAIALTFASYWLRAVRWQYLLLHEGKIRIAALYPAVIIGYMANNLFPAKAGEVIRAWVLAEREKRPFGSVIASLVIDRLCDGLCMLLMLMIVLFALQLPPGMHHTTTVMRAGGVTTLLVYLGGIGFLLLLRHRTAWTLKLLDVVLKPFPEWLSTRVLQLAGTFISGLQLSRNSGHLLAVAILSVLIWITATVPIYLVLRGFALDLPASAALLIMVLLLFAVMLPSAPGYIGTFHLACYTGLSAYGLTDNQSVSVALVIHGVGFFPVILAGFYHVWSQGISLRNIRQQAAAEGGQP